MQREGDATAELHMHDGIVCCVAHSVKSRIYCVYCISLAK